MPGNLWQIVGWIVIAILAIVVFQQIILPLLDKVL